MNHLQDPTAIINEFERRLVGTPMDTGGLIRYMVAPARGGKILFETDSVSQADAVKRSVPGSIVLLYDRRSIQRRPGLNEQEGMFDPTLGVGSHVGPGGDYRGTVEFSQGGMPICARCRKESEDGEFCTNCGAVMAAAAAEAAEAAKKAAGKPVTEKKDDDEEDEEDDEDDDESGDDDDEEDDDEEDDEEDDEDDAEEEDAK
jgi:hypothetical protein